jgi:hypothetical protein
MRIFKKRENWRIVMTTQTNSHLPKKRISPYERYIGKYVVIYPSGINTHFSGKLIQIEENYGLLKPFQSGEYDDRGKIIRKISNKESSIPLIGAAIETTTRKNLENFCKSLNKEVKSQNQPASKKS